MTIKEKIESTLNSLDKKMKSQAHLKDDLKESVIEDIDFLTKCFSALDDDDREFLGAVKFAVRSQIRWD